ncbi:MAG: hypothetical protein DMD44_07190 [Gemmatimonadetes bacterium]|nr:MAG: hypothetical protein DMD44_07190 [Gemmatimonadota bacterium]
MKQGIGALLVAVITLPALAAAQTEMSVGLGVGTVRYTAGAGFGTAVLSPTVRYASATLAADVAGAVASLPRGVWAGQGLTGLSVITPPIHTLRFGAELAVGGTTRSDSGSTAAAHAVAELSRSFPTWGLGIGAGPSTGVIAGDLPVTALHTRARMWWRPEGGPGAPELQLSVEPTRFPDGWFTDASLTGTVERGRAIVSVWVAGRMSPAFPAEGAGGASAQFFATPRVSLELSGGSYLPDPYQGFPQVGFVSVGVRLHRSARAPHVRFAPLVPGVRGDSAVVRFRMAGARSVAMAGDWNSWEQVPLRPLGDEVWEGVLRLRRGLYHFNLLVDGSDWVVPNGVATVPDGLGGMVAVLIVP